MNNNNVLASVFKRFIVRHSIVKKMSLSAIIPLIIFSIIFSAVFYYTSMGIINNQLIPNFEQVLETKINGFQTSISAELINKAKTDKTAYEELRKVVDEISQQGQVELVYIMSKVNGEDVILVLNGTEDYLTPYPFTPEQNATLEKPSEVSFSEIYEDPYGVHKSVFYSIEGTDSVLGIDMDAKFIYELKDMVILVSTALTIVFVIVGASVSIFVSHRLTKPLIQLVDHTRKVAQGDLSAKLEVTSQDEVGELVLHFNQMTERLRAMIVEVKDTVQYVEKSADELAHRMEQSTKMIYDGAAAFQEIASGNETMNTVTMENNIAIQEVALGMQQINESITTASEESLNTVKQAGQGEQFITTAVSQMSSISEAVTHSEVLVKQMNERSREINGVVDMIKDIAGQINLLSLNAAIEAARAGEHGRGFAVVSNEIRKLADQTTTFSDEIFQTVHTIQEDSIKSTEAMQIVTDEVKSGTYSVQEAGKTFITIKDLVAKVSDKFSSVSAVTEEVSAMMEEISANAENVTEVTAIAEGNSKRIAASSQEQLAMHEETAKSAGLLRERAAILNQMVNQFTL